MRRVAVIGAGVGGLTIALRLAEAGFTVQLFEQYPQPGGLARSFTVGGEPLEAFYHHLFTTDVACCRLASELGLAQDIEWLSSRMGLYTEGRAWDFGTPLSLLRFAPLTFVDKLRFALTTLWLQRCTDPARFAGITAARWLQDRQGARVWRHVWSPLLTQKFAELADEVAMVWLWGKLRLRGRSRTRTGLGERLGYLRGSFLRLTEALSQRFSQLGGRLRLGEKVRTIEKEPGGLVVVTRSERSMADQVVVATPIPDYLDIAGHLLPPERVADLARLKATSALCTVLELDRAFSPYYWLNIADAQMPFGGLVEHTNLVPAQRYGGRHILYISNYVMRDHPAYRTPKDELLAQYYPALGRINPAFDPSWVVASHHFRAGYAQPVITVGYAEQIPDHRTEVQGLYLASMAQIYPEDRGMNYAIAFGERVARSVIEDAV